ncbi:MAG TPA: GvpL/GvpF family gas vesicle protein [Streptosporangiaceae bacterium]|nr:GvpL/GvpF family gas vesicle protein [Streptosporangiaceae bacterium]
MGRTLMTRNGVPPRTRSWQVEWPSGSAENQVIWVYAITDDLGPRQFHRLTGVGGEQVRSVPEAGLTAIVGSVDARGFGEQALASLLGGLDNIERVGRAHHQVIARVAAAGGTVLPLRLATVYPDDDTVRALLAQRRGEFAGMLDRFRDTVEWGVQIYLAAGSYQAMTGQAAGGLPAAVPSARREALADPDEVVDHAEAFADAIDWVLNDIAVVSRRQPAADPQFAGRADWMVLNGAYLLRSDRVAEFTAAAHALAGAHPGARAVVNGPWPPYSFVDQLEA